MDACQPGWLSLVEELRAGGIRADLAGGSLPRVAPVLFPTHRLHVQATQERQSELIHGSAQPLHEEGAPVGVVPVEHRASVSADEAEDGRLVEGSFPVPGTSTFRTAVIPPARVARHEGLRPALVPASDCDRPVGLQARDKRRQSCEQPVLGAGCVGVASHDSRHLDHCRSLTSSTRSHGPPIPLSPSTGTPDRFAGHRAGGSAKAFP